jgi:anti-sigma regulatory factor (Ser/Thr protein kinase)
MRRRPVRDELGDVGPAIAWAGEQIPTSPARTRYAVEVCLEEALANLILHGATAAGAKEITLALGEDEFGVTIEITDRCAPFDVAHAAVPAGGGLHEGGQGLGLMHAFASELAYESGEAGNRLTLRFRQPG